MPKSQTPPPLFFRERGGGRVAGDLLQAGRPGPRGERGGAAAVGGGGCAAGSLVLQEIGSTCPPAWAAKKVRLIWH